MNENSPWAEYDGVSEIRVNALTLANGTAFIRFNFLHEMMHTLGYSNIGFGCPQNSSIMQPSDPRPDILQNLTQGDRCAMRRDFAPREPGWDDDYLERCDPFQTEDPCDPLILSFGHGTLKLSPPDVHFDLRGDGRESLYSWTEPGSEDAFLVVDRNGNGTIDDGTELFGNTPVPGRQAVASGVEALRWYDEPSNGGNADRAISSADAAFGDLQLWFDRNHDGRSDPDELEPLSNRVARIQLQPQVIGRQDQFGNYFRMRIVIELVSDGRGSQEAFGYDVFLVRRDK
jgi:hypothetical protein